MASTRLLIQTMDSWRADLKHIKEAQRKIDEQRRKRQQKTKIKNSKAPTS
jgi:hypothetical protein